MARTRPSQRSLFAKTARQKLAYQADQFQRIFGVSLSEFRRGPGHFDMSRFDREVVQSGLDYIADVVARKFGPEAVSLITQLL